VALQSVYTVLTYMTQNVIMNDYSTFSKL